VVDPTPITGARPGTAVAVIASCVAIGGGAAACVEQGIDPLGAAKGLIASAPEKTVPPPEAAAGTRRQHRTFKSIHRNRIESQL